MLRIAVPNKGSLSEPASQMLAEAGYLQRSDSRELVLLDAVNDTEFFFLRPRDIATYVGAGQLDVGITGNDLLLDSSAPAEPILELGFGQSTFRFAAHAGTARSAAELAGKRVATAYPGVVTAYFARAGIVADVIADVVSTGTTLRNAGLAIFGEPLLTSQAVLIRNRTTDGNGRIEQLVRRLQGVIIARQYVLMDYDIPNELVPQAVAITPGIESPTVSPLHERGWSAVRSMVERPRTNHVMDELWDLGARGILVTDIHACRL